MASFWSNYLRNKINDHFRGVTSFTTPGTTYFALMSAAPTVTGGGTEVTLVSRLSITNTSTHWTTSSLGVTKNATDMVFTSSASADLGTIVGIAEYDASSAGNLLTYGDLAVAKTITTGMGFSVLANNGQFSYIDA